MSRTTLALTALVYISTTACAGTPMPPSTRAAPRQHGAPPPVAPNIGSLTTPPAPLTNARIAVRTHVSAAADVSTLAPRLATQTRAVLDGHPDVTTDVARGSALGLPVVALDAAATCQFSAHAQHVELDCGVRFALSDTRGRMLSTWQRSVTLTGPVHGTRTQLVDDAVDHALRGLPDRLLRTLDSTGSLASH